MFGRDERQQACVLIAEGAGRAALEVTVKAPDGDIWVPRTPCGHIGVPAKYTESVPSPPYLPMHIPTCISRARALHVLNFIFSLARPRLHPSSSSQILNNESGFTERDVRSLCDLGRSSKVAPYARPTPCPHPTHTSGTDLPASYAGVLAGQASIQCTRLTPTTQLTD
eukprot:2833482-Rhodomonas_salina.1